MTGDEVDPPDRCPKCKANLEGYSAEYRRKHIERCNRVRPKYIYSNNPRGRPPIKKPIRTPAKAMSATCFVFTTILFSDLLFHIP